MRMRRLFLALFALISSCGPAPEGPPDTVAVAPGTRSEDQEAPVALSAAEPLGGASQATAHAASIPNVEDATLLGFAGSRYAIIDTRTSTLVFDADAASAFGVYGHALTTNTTGAWDIWASADFTGDLLPSAVLTSADGSRLVVKTEGGVQVVDLGNRGKMLTGVRMENMESASLAPDGESFAAWNDRELTLVRVSDGARVSYPLTFPGGQPGTDLQWTSRAAMWKDGASARIVDRATWRLQTTEGADAQLTASKDGSVVVVALPSLVEIWRSGEARPAAHIVTKDLTNVVIDEPGRNVAWVEYSGEYGAKSMFHTIEVETAAHHRFPSQAPNCELTHEYLLGIENGELRADGECSPGCPSMTRQSDFRTYDVKTGKVVRHWMGDVERAFNEDLGARVAIGEGLAKLFGFTEQTRPIKHHPSADLVLVQRLDALRLADHRSGAARTTLEQSARFSLETTHFWPESGARVIGVSGAEVVVWDSASGERVWASRR